MKGFLILKMNNSLNIRVIKVIIFIFNEYEADSLNIKVFI